MDPSWVMATAILGKWDKRYQEMQYDAVCDICEQSIFHSFTHEYQSWYESSKDLATLSNG